MSGVPTDPHERGDWLRGEEQRLLRCAEAARDPGLGFGWLDERGALDRSRPVQLWITARMTYVFALAHLRGHPGAGEQVDHGLAALAGPLRDLEHDGWFPSDPSAEVPTEKKAYDHAFVVLAAAASAAAARPGAEALLADALAVVERRFWDEAAGLVVDVWDRSWSELEPYRGANANMHTVEAFLAAADVTGEQRWRDRALGIAERLVHGHARANDWRLPEHFDPDWRMLPDYNREEPAHPFRPYGATVGHWFEWARLLCHLHLAHPDPPGWLLDDARALVTAGVREGWAVDGGDGFVYTIDWDGTPVVRERMHWVVTEAIGAAAVLHALTGDPTSEEWLWRWWDYADRHLIDRADGCWRHELDAANQPSAVVWAGKPDVYHAYQAVLLTQLEPATSLVAALRG